MPHLHMVSQHAVGRHTTGVLKTHLYSWRHEPMSNIPVGVLLSYRSTIYIFSKLSAFKRRVCFSRPLVVFAGIKIFPIVEHKCPVVIWFRAIGDHEPKKRILSLHAHEAPLCIMMHWRWNGNIATAPKRVDINLPRQLVLKATLVWSMVVNGSTCGTAVRHGTSKHVCRQTLMKTHRASCQHASCHVDSLFLM